MVTRRRAPVKKHTVFGVSGATHLVNLRIQRRRLQAQRRSSRLFASLQHLESLWFMWEIWEATRRANVVIVSEPTLRKCYGLRNCVCVCVSVCMCRNTEVPQSGGADLIKALDEKDVIVWIHFQK